MKYVYVDAEPARLHIATLHGALWSDRAISAATHPHVSYSAVTSISRGERTRVRDITSQGILTIDPLVVPSATVRGIDPMVSKVGSIRRLQALMAIGWSHPELTRRLGFQTGKFCHQSYGGRCLASTHRAIADLYRELAGRPGPSESSRRWARKLGYVSPVMWDDIDHDEAPEVDALVDARDQDSVDDVMVQLVIDRRPRPRLLTRAETDEAYRRLLAAGLTAHTIRYRYHLQHRRDAA